MLAPCTVSDMDPVPSTLLRRITLSPGKSTDKPWLRLPPRSPMVITTRRVPLRPCPTRQRNDVCDAHSVAWHPVCPCRVRAV
jgi:hypothetical protein